MTQIEATAHALLRKRSLKQYLNPDWKSLDAAGKRIAVALDVIRSVVVTEQYQARVGVYVSQLDLMRAANYNASADVKTLLNGKLERCDCCELGACFLSVVRFENKAKVRDAANSAFDRFLNRPPARKRLEELFGREQIVLMESAFEQDDMAADEDAPFTAIRFGNKYDSSRVRMLAININIVQNGGEFKPEVPLKLVKKEVA